MDDITTRASEMGAERGKNAASWTFDGNTSTDTYRDFLRKHDDGDPALWDDYGPTSGWLSGEWADDTNALDLQRELGIADEDDPDGEILAEACTAYEDAADEAYMAELERVANLQLED